MGDDGPAGVGAVSTGERFNYYPYGGEVTPTADGKVKFGTYLRDSAGVDYATNRYYANGVGRFMTADPSGLAGIAAGDPGSLNSYAYVQGDPINFNDPTGQTAVCTVQGISCSMLPACDEFWASAGDEPGCRPVGIEDLCSLTGIGMPFTSIPGLVCFQIAGGLTPRPPRPDCNSITAAVGFDGLTYDKASLIWNDGDLATYSTRGAAARIGALGAVTWQSESSFSLNPINNPNRNGQGAITSVDYGPFQINRRFNPNSNREVWGTNGAGQRFNGDPDANIGFGISILEGLNAHYGNTAAGRYVGSQGNPNAQRRQAAWNTWDGRLTKLFSNTDCFPHR